MPDSLQPVTATQQPRNRLVRVVGVGKQVQFPNGRPAVSTGGQALLTEDEFNDIPAAFFTDGTLLDVGLQGVPVGTGDLKRYSIPLKLASITVAADVVSITPGFAGTIRGISAVVSVPVTTAAKLATLSLKIGAVAVTGGAVALTSANCTPQGAVIAGTAITAANVITSASVLTIAAASVTAFTEGVVVVEFSIDPT